MAEWIRTVEVLDPDRLRRAFSYPMADSGCMMVGGVLYRSETKKPDEERNWPDVLERLNALAEWSRGRGLELLWACAVRHRLVIMGKHLGELQACESAAERAFRSASDDPRVRYLLCDSVGEFLLRADRAVDALTWLERALGYETESFVLERLLTLVNASRATAVIEPARCLAYLHEAGRRARACEDLPETEAARVSGEIAIGEGLTGNLPAAFRALDYGVELLLECRAETNRWKVLFVLFGHATGYFMSMARRGNPPERTAGGEPYLEPRRGCFYSHDPSIGGLYDGSKDWGIALQLALYADAIGEDGRAAVWGARALDLARGSGHRSIVEHLAPCFIPQLILGDRYAEAIEAALDHGAIQAARALEPETARTNWLQPIADLDTILGERPNANWQRAEEWSAMTGVLPAAVRICSVALESPEAARSAANELISICRQIGAGASDPALWSDIADLFEKGFVEPVSGGELKGIADGLPAIGTTRKLLALLFASMRSDITAENALIIHLSMLPCLSQVFDRPFAAYRLMLVPFVSDYWNAIFRRMRFRFCRPQLVQAALAEANASPVKATGGWKSPPC